MSLPGPQWYEVCVHHIHIYSFSQLEGNPRNFGGMAEPQMEVAWFPNSPGIWEKANNQECLPLTFLEQDGNFNYARAPAFSNSAVRAAALPLKQELQKYFMKKRKFTLIPPSTSGATPGKCIAHLWLGAQIQCHLSAIFFLVPRLLLLVNGSILFSFFNVCHPLLRCCWPWNSREDSSQSTNTLLLIKGSEWQVKWDMFLLSMLSEWHVI